MSVVGIVTVLGYESLRAEGMNLPVMGLGLEL
jgi:hypothetical protein